VNITDSGDVMRHGLGGEQTSQYWDGLARGELWIQHCSSCNRFQFYPGYVCRTCGAPNPGWVSSAGRGVLYSFTVVRGRNGSTVPPHVVVVVELEEGVRVMGVLLDCEREDVSVGLAVEIAPTIDRQGQAVCAFIPSRV
jgi:uncharacterized OB-fold protein